ncbi:hypothetical protein LXA43DRAFT_262250 [Ganoderma leucocontextum]|nr:hypothetical protein LXA43DRAFT_262250 [Ganoderma leucocontextum]
MLIRSFAAYRHVFTLILSSLLLLSLPDAASGAPQNVTIRFDSSQVPASFTTGWRVAEFKGSGLSGSVDKFAFANSPGEELTVQLPQNVIALSYRGFKIKGGGLYYACLDCDASVDTAVTVDAHDETENGTQHPETLFAFTDVDPRQSHVLRVINLEDDRFNETSQITFDSLVLTFKDEDSTVSTASTGSTTSTTSDGATPTVPRGGNPTTTVTVGPTDGSSSASTGTTSESLRTGMAMTSSSDSQATTPSASGNGHSASQTQTSSNPSPTSSGSRTQTGSSATSSGGLQPTSSAGSGSDTTTSAAPGKGASNGGVSKTVIIVVAVIASVFVLALLAAIIWLLVRNQPPPRGDIEGSAGVMRQAAPAAITVSGPFPLSPMRPEIPNPFVDPLDELSPPPRSAPPPPIPPRSPLRATGDRPAWLTRVPRTPSPGSLNE